MRPYLLYHLLEPVHLECAGQAHTISCFRLCSRRMISCVQSFFRFLSRCIHISTYAGLMLQSSLCQHVKDRLEMMNDG